MLETAFESSLLKNSMSAKIQAFTTEFFLLNFVACQITFPKDCEIRKNKKQELQLIIYNQMTCSSSETRLS